MALHNNLLGIIEILNWYHMELIGVFIELILG